MVDSYVHHSSDLQLYGSRTATAAPQTYVRTTVRTINFKSPSHAYLYCKVNNQQLRKYVRTYAHVHAMSCVHAHMHMHMYIIIYMYVQYVHNIPKGEVET